MFITYRRTGGVSALLALAAVALAATVLTVTVAATMTILALAMAAAAFLARAVLPASWRHRPVPAAAFSAHETIEATVVHPTASADNRDLVRTGRDRETIG